MEVVSFASQAIAINKAENQLLQQSHIVDNNQTTSHKELRNGYYFNINGLFDVRISNGLGNNKDVYIFNKKISNNNYIGLRKLNIDYPNFIKIAKTVYGESSAFKIKGIDVELSKEMFAIAYVIHKNPKAAAYGEHSKLAQIFSDTQPAKRNGTKMILTIGAVINARINGHDYSNGATNWDGIEQATAFPIGFKGASNGKFEAHRNTWGWEISQDHYDK